jgi:hypothetical protein
MVRKMNGKIHEVDSVWAEREHLVLVIDGQAYHVAWTECSPRLAKASDLERNHIEVSPSGYGLHWPLLDEDLAITPLLQMAMLVESPV